MKEEAEAEIEADIKPDDEKFEIIQSTLVSRMDVHHTKTEANHEELIAARKANHERTEALMDVSVKTTEAFLESKEPTS
jgi:hypothetical protein